MKKICDHTIPESTARKFRDAYLTALKASSTASSGHVSVASLPCKPKGRPLMLGDLDKDVQEYVRQLRVVGGVINTDVVMAAARGVVESKKLITTCGTWRQHCHRKVMGKVLTGLNELCEAQGLIGC